MNCDLPPSGVMGAVKNAGDKRGVGKMASKGIFCVKCFGLMLDAGYHDMSFYESIHE